MKSDYIYLLECNLVEWTKVIGVFNKLSRAKYLLRKLPDKYTYSITAYHLNRSLCKSSDINAISGFNEEEYYGRKVTLRTFQHLEFENIAEEINPSTKLKNVFFLECWNQFANKKVTIGLGCFSSHFRAWRLLKSLPKRYNYLIEAFPLNEKLIKGYDPDQLSCSNHWHYGTERLFYETEERTHYWLSFMGWHNIGGFEVRNIPCEMIDKALDKLDSKRKTPKLNEWDEIEFEFF